MRFCEVRWLGPTSAVKCSGLEREKSTVVVPGCVDKAETCEPHRSQAEKQNKKRSLAPAWPRTHIERAKSVGYGKVRKKKGDNTTAVFERGVEHEK